MWKHLTTKLQNTDRTEKTDACTITDLNTINQVDLIDIYGALCPEAEPALFASARPTFIRRNHIQAIKQTSTNF